ncbi:MAG: heme exporter protein CcmD [Burkholderiaceae bacterium]
MHWQDANDFFSMGGRGAFVWGAYGVMAALLLAEALLVRRRHRAARRAIAERLEDEAAARTAATPEQGS